MVICILMVSLKVALFILMVLVSRITLKLLGVKIIPCRVASLIDIHLKQKDWCQSNLNPIALRTAKTP